MPIHDLSSKVVLLTGIGSVGKGDGNGTTIALLFARQGALIYGCDINLEAAQSASKRIADDAEARSHASRNLTAFVDVHPHSVVGELAPQLDLLLTQHDRMSQNMPTVKLLWRPAWPSMAKLISWSTTWVNQSQVARQRCRKQSGIAR